MSTNTWDEIQETIMIVGALGLWGGFETLCFFNTEFAALPHVGTTRTAIITIVTNLFTFKFTKSLPSAKNGGTGSSDEKQ
ncbi:hypothetical protein F4X10_06620 [Candidatus Poribacteria bacterium]|nr:hypothetical protein [Candidatus Poribacteria bacterium]MYC75427.1 hypothetical protein [Candidatus Poribacteria bacterium]